MRFFVVLLDNPIVLWNLSKIISLHFYLYVMIRNIFIGFLFKLFCFSVVCVCVCFILCSFFIAIPVDCDRAFHQITWSHFIICLYVFFLLLLFLFVILFVSGLALAVSRTPFANIFRTHTKFKQCSFSSVHLFHSASIFIHFVCHLIFHHIDCCAFVYRLIFFFFSFVLSFFHFFCTYSTHFSYEGLNDF